MKQYFAYTRVSTARQGEHGVSLEEQRHAIARYAHQHQLDISEWFEERQTAASRGRPVFGRMLKLLRGHKADGVVMHKIDRSARNLRDWADLAELVDEHVEIHFAHETIDLLSRAGRLSADIQAVVAADYIRNLREETKKGFYGRLKQGFYPRPAPPGYANAGPGKAKVIDPVQGPIVRQAFEEYATGRYTLKQLTTWLQEAGLRTRSGKRVSVNGVSTILNNPFYMGLIVIAKTAQSFQGNHPVLVSPALFDRVHRVLHGRTSPRGRSHHFLFRRLFRCARCRYSLIGECKKGNVYYRCHSSTCRGTCVREESIDLAFRSLLARLHFSEQEQKWIEGLLVEMRCDWAEEHARLQRECAMRCGQVDDRIKRLTDAYLDAVLDRATFEERRKALLIERLELGRQAATLADRHADPVGRMTEFLELAGNACSGYEIATPDEKRDLLELLTSNRVIETKTPVFTLSEPFSMIAARHKSQSGSPQRGSTRTARLLRAICDWAARNSTERAPGASAGSSRDGLAPRESLANLRAA